MIKSADFGKCQRVVALRYFMRGLAERFKVEEALALHNAALKPYSLPSKPVCLEELSVKELNRKSHFRVFIYIRHLRQNLNGPHCANIAWQVYFQAYIKLGKAENTLPFFNLTKYFHSSVLVVKY